MKHNSSCIYLDLNSYSVENPKLFLQVHPTDKEAMKICGQSHLHTEAKELSGAMGQGRTELFLHLVSPRATSQEIQLLDGPPRSNSHFQRDPHCVYTYTYTYTCILFPNKRLSSWTRPLVVLVSAVCSACVSLCAWHKYVCAVGAVCKCAWWENTLSLTPGET